MNKRFFLLFILWIFFSSLIILALSTNLINLTDDYDQYSNQSLNDPLSSLEESPFDSENIFQDSNFIDGHPWWNYTSSSNITSDWDSDKECAKFNHSSGVPSETFIKSFQIQNAFYHGTNENFTSEFLEDDGTTGQVKRWQNLDVNFSDYLNNGDNITLKINSGDAANITIYDFQSQTPVGGYGQGIYPGSVTTEFNITLNNLTSPKKDFNFWFELVLPQDRVHIDLIIAYANATKLKTFPERAYVNQSVSIENLYNSSYSLNFTTNVSVFEGIDIATLSIKINDSMIWAYQISSTLPPTKFSVDIPDFINNGGTYTISFEIELNINTSDVSNFSACLDDVYFLKKPLLNLIKNSNFNSDQDWQNYTSGGNYQSTYNSSEKLFDFSSFQTGGGLVDGWTSLNQTFLKNNSRLEYQLVLNYLMLSTTGIKTLYLEVYLNNSLVLNESNLKTSTSWTELRLNISQSLEDDQYYEISFKFNIIADIAENIMNWTGKLDDIYIYPLWESQINMVQAPKTDLFPGEETDMNIYYNTSITGDPIKDAKVRIYDNDTQNEWGLDFSSSKKYLINNKNNGTYILTVGSIGIDAGIYNLSILFIRPNFPDKYYFCQFNITGISTNFTIVEGAYFNETYNTWLIHENNTPYVDDNTKLIKIYIWDNISLNPLVDAFIEAKLADNSLYWAEIYKTSGNYDDRGYYEIFLDTTNIGVVNEYLNLNLSIKISIQGYQPFCFNVSTLVNSLPTEIILDEIGPIFEGSKTSLSLFFNDLFHDSGIDNANITWQILETPALQGQLDFIFQGVYREEIDINTLTGGNYTLQLMAEKINYDISIITKNLEIIAKRRITITITSLPQNIYEENYFSIQYNFSLTEQNEALSDALINIRIFYWNSSTEEIYAKYTDNFGLVSINNMFAPINERKITINVSYSGVEDIAPNLLLTDLSILPKNEINITLINKEGLEEIIYIGESNVEIIAKAIYVNSNNTPVANIEIIFQIGNSINSTFTNELGIAKVIISLPVEGNYTIDITSTGNNTIKGISISPVRINILSPTTIFTRNFTVLLISLAIVAVVATSSFLVVKFAYLNPKLKEKRGKYLDLMNKFDDANNMVLNLVIDKESGVDLYSKSITEMPLDPTLISGFLQAITTFGEKVVTPTKVSKGIKFDILLFQNFLIIIEEGNIIRTALLLKETPSDRLKQAIDNFTLEIETKYGDEIINSTTHKLNQKELGELIEKHFEISLAYPHQVGLKKSKKYELNKWEQIVIDYFQTYFYEKKVFLDKIIQNLIRFHKGKEFEISQAILNLRKLGILKVF